LISGGPAWRGKDLEARYSDKSSTRQAVDVVGMRLDDVVKKIKGPKGQVRLTVKR
jgi:carboxyl-terminal processing protease